MTDRDAGKVGESIAPAHRWHARVRAGAKTAGSPARRGNESENESGTGLVGRRRAAAGHIRYNMRDRLVIITIAKSAPTAAPTPSST